MLNKADVDGVWLDREAILTGRPNPQCEPSCRPGVLVRATTGIHAMPPKTSRDLPGPLPRKDKEREMTEAVIEDADKSDGVDRDREHGDGATLDLPPDRNDRKPER
jgi:hypothetical protein